MMFARRSLFLTVIVMAIAMTGTAVGQVEVRVASLARDGSARMKLQSMTVAEIRRQTQSRVGFKYYAKGAYGDEREMVRKLNLAQIDGAELSSVGLSLIDESIRVLELPRMFATVEELDYVADKLWPHFQEKFAKKGYLLAGRGSIGWVHVMSKGEIRSLSDFKAAKIWLEPDDSITRALYKRLGVAGIALGVSDVEPALNMGRINAFYSSHAMALELNWSSKIKCMTSLPMGHALSGTVIRKDSLKMISVSDQALVLKLNVGMSAKLRSMVRADNESARKQMERSGAMVSDNTADFIVGFDKAAKAVWSDLTDKAFSKAELDMVLKHRDEYRAKNGTQ
jgi:TRAP-type C4-dicarboxylate transport system substrate-binding protein